MPTPYVNWRRNPICVVCGGIGSVGFFGECLCAEGAEFIDGICQVIFKAKLKLIESMAYCFTNNMMIIVVDKKFSLTLKLIHIQFLIQRSFKRLLSCETRQHLDIVEIRGKRAQTTSDS